MDNIENEEFCESCMIPKKELKSAKIPVDCKVIMEDYLGVND